MFKNMEFYGHEQVVFSHDEETGLKAIIGVHSTVLGPALGGTRMWNYKSEEDAIYDVLRLSRGMSLKNSAAGLNLGGGKAVILGDPSKLKNEDFLRAYGSFVERLNGSYITAEDVNISVEDAEIIKQTTKYVAGQKDKSGDPSPFTAQGVFRGIVAAVEEKFNKHNLSGLTVAVQGLGKVGYNLCERLNEVGVNLIVADINENVVQKAVKEFGAKATSVDEILGSDCDIFAPSALGAVINTQNISRLKCKIIAGAANNVLVDGDAGDLLHEKNILYIPDYIINAGGVINVSMEVEGEYSTQKAVEKVDKIYDNVKNVLDFANSRGIPTYMAADEMAMKRIIEAKSAKNKKFVLS